MRTRFMLVFLLVNACHDGAKGTPPVAPVTSAKSASPPVPTVTAHASWEVPVVTPTDGTVDPDPSPEDAAAMPDFVVTDAGAPLGAGVTLPPPCVDPAKHASVTRALAMGMATPFAFNDSGIEIDLDGDGTNDAVIDGGAARREVDYLLYVKRGGCAYHVGSFSSSDGVARLTAKHKGLFDLKTVSDDCTSLGGPGGGWCEIVYRFDGKRYTKVSERKTSRPRGARP